MNQVAIKLTSAIGISGVLYRAGSIVEVSEDAAKNLLHRGKGVLATAADEDEPEADDSGSGEGIESEAAVKKGKSKK